MCRISNVTVCVLLNRHRLKSFRELANSVLPLEYGRLSGNKRNNTYNAEATPYNKGA